MKIKLTLLLAVAIMSMSSVYAAEAQGPISKWLDNLTGSVAQKEQRAHQKSVERQQKLAAKQKAREQKIAKKKAKARQKQLERQRKQQQQQRKIEKKKRLITELFSND